MAGSASEMLSVGSPKASICFARSTRPDCASARLPPASAAQSGRACSCRRTGLLLTWPLRRPQQPPCARRWWPAEAGLQRGGCSHACACAGRLCLPMRSPALFPGVDSYGQLWQLVVLLEPQLPTCHACQGTDCPDFWSKRSSVRPPIRLQMHAAWFHSAAGDTGMSVQLGMRIKMNQLPALLRQAQKNTSRECM